MEVGGVKLVPREKPHRRGSGTTDWAKVVGEFLASGEECVEVLIAGRAPKGIYQSLQGYTRTRKDCYASAAGGICTLVRIQK